MTRREWKVGERCWVAVDGLPVVGVVKETSDASVCVQHDTNHVTYRLKGDAFRTCAEARVSGAKADVEYWTSELRYHDRVAKEKAATAKGKRRELDRAKKRLAALRAKVKP